MSAKVLDGKALALIMKSRLLEEVNGLKRDYRQSPRIVCVVVGNDPAGLSYALSQQRTAESLGIHFELQQQPETISQSALTRLIEGLNNYDQVHGIILNKPLPQSIDFNTIVSLIQPKKDIERLNLCTPAAAMLLLESSGVDVAGKEAVVLGRSEIVGRPVANLLLDKHVTVTICHSATAKANQLEFHLSRADIVVAAIGKPAFVKGEHIKQGSIIIDVGINEVNGKIVGDVDFSSCVSKAAFISPVPGGVGPITSVILMQNAINAFRNIVCQKH